MFQKFVSVAFLCCLPIFVFSHGSHGSGVMSGFTHPILGIDHALALLGVGSLGYLQNPSRWYLQVGIFVLAMVAGGLFGIGNEATLFIEKTIALSVLVIGWAIAFRHRINLLASLIFIGVFGAFHGFAHGAEMGDANTALKYISGYALGASLVGLVGMLLARYFRALADHEKYIHLLGGSLIGAGIILLLP